MLKTIDFRSVQEEEKAFALGVQFVMLRLFGKLDRPLHN